MFTGIITNMGKVSSIEGSRITVQANRAFCRKIEKGTSISVNGVCLTAITRTNQTFSVTLMPETAKKTMFSKIKIEDRVNLELPVTAETLLSGHIVQGHVDQTGKITGIENQGNSKILTIKINSGLSRYIVEKGAIAINGISLTVIDCSKNFFTVGIIPFTWKYTMLQDIKPGDLVNIETDILAKYLEKLTRKEDKSK